MSRYPDLSPDEMDADQQRVYEAILSGPRGAIGGPFPALLRSPALCDRVQELGRVIRFESSLPGAVRELAILVAGRHWTAQYEWWAHSWLGLAEGLDQSVIDAVRDGDESVLGDPLLQVTRELATSLLSTGRVSDALHERATSLLGERGVIEVVATVGYYCLVSFVLNTAQVPLPPDATPLPDR
ncbi:MAG: carboxymuconolactone decarboxylase family protein [Actinobacteria bacterium]|nr:carboxymuconolactone decarboxylase family protein [Actinomycetota bacterium]